MLDKILKYSFLSALLLAAVCTLPATRPGTYLNDADNPVQLRLGMETGFVKVLSNQIQFGHHGDMFDYVSQGGEDILFPFNRYTADVSFKRHHELMLLYQPLDVQTEELLLRDVRIDTLLYPANTPVDLRYGFSFWRFSYLYNFMNDPEKEMALGLSLQLRDASISFASKDGRLLRVSQNLGPVPAIKFRTQWPLNGQSWLGAEVDGIYATSAIFNGANFSFEGSLYDVSLRYGYKFNESIRAFINARFLGGNAKGDGYVVPGFSDGYTDNALNTFALTLGFYLK